MTANFENIEENVLQPFVYYRSQSTKINALFFTFMLRNKMCMKWYSFLVRSLKRIWRLNNTTHSRHSWKFHHPRLFGHEVEVFSLDKTPCDVAELADTWEQPQGTVSYVLVIKAWGREGGRQKKRVPYLLSRSRKETRNFVVHTTMVPVSKGYTTSWRFDSFWVQ